MQGLSMMPGLPQGENSISVSFAPTPAPSLESYDRYPNSKEELTQNGYSNRHSNHENHRFSSIPTPSLYFRGLTLSPVSQPFFWKPLTIAVSFFSQTNMAGAQFEYDEKGTTFYYFLLSFFGIVLVPVTYYVWKVTKLPGKLWKSSQLYAKQQWILVRTQLSSNKRTIHNFVFLVRSLEQFNFRWSETSS